MKVYSLEWNDDDPIFDFKLLGLSTTFTKDYDFVFYINKFFRFNFKRIDDQEIIENGVTYIFSIYRFYHEITKQNIELMSNYSFPQIIKENLGLFEEMEKTKILIPELKSFNYFLKSDFLLDEDFYVTLSKLENIQEYKEIDIEDIKINNLENLILST